MNTSEFARNSEHWLSIDGYSNYEVSWYGRVRNATTDRIMKPGLGGNGYLIINLMRLGGEKPLGGIN